MTEFIFWTNMILMFLIFLFSIYAIRINKENKYTLGVVGWSVVGIMMFVTFVSLLIVYIKEIVLY